MCLPACRVSSASSVSVVTRSSCSSSASMRMYCLSKRGRPGAEKTSAACRSVSGKRAWHMRYLQITTHPAERTDNQCPKQQKNDRQAEGIELRSNDSLYDGKKQAECHAGYKKKVTAVCDSVENKQQAQTVACERQARTARGRVCTGRLFASAATAISDSTKQIKITAPCYAK